MLSTSAGWGTNYSKDMESTSSRTRIVHLAPNVTRPPHDQTLLPLPSLCTPSPALPLMDYNRKEEEDHLKMRGRILALAFEFTGTLWRGWTQRIIQEHNVVQPTSMHPSSTYYFIQEFLLTFQNPVHDAAKRALAPSSSNLQQLRQPLPLASPTKHEHQKFDSNGDQPARRMWGYRATDSLCLLNVSVIFSLTLPSQLFNTSLAYCLYPAFQL
ncbi:hypothetical protein M405DRAFT_860994 [Rhizopogon salebrosus TDB-379]|nr:hypothetical protein M405DRAFT_860994 [Rhizopogon salebrosus TDB-379]